MATTRRRAIRRGMLTILWEDVAECPAQRALIERVFKVACTATNTPASVEVTVLLTDDARLEVLNRTYRHQNAPTDVLSFPQRDTPLENAGFKPALPADGGECLGDIAISMPRVQAQAAAYGHSKERELAYLFVHGFLHLIGHVHSEETDHMKMRAQEEAILTAAGLPRFTGTT